MQKRKKKVDPDAPIRPWAAIVTWLMLNLIWMSFSPMATPHPVLSEEGGHREYYEMTAPDVLGAELPFEIDCKFGTTYSEQSKQTPHNPLLLVAELPGQFKGISVIPLVASLR